MVMKGRPMPQLSEEELSSMLNSREEASVCTVVLSRASP